MSGESSYSKEDVMPTMGRAGREVRIEIFSEHANVDKLDHAMESVKKAMKWDEQRFGREYDLDIFNIVAVNDFNMGAMENKGSHLIIPPLDESTRSTTSPPYSVFY